MFGASRDLAPSSSLDLSLSYSEFERQQGLVAGADGLSRDYDTEAMLRINRKASARITLSGEAGYLNRSGASNYDGWWVALRARYEP
jgi:hypothetical protein